MKWILNLIFIFGLLPLIGSGQNMESENSQTLKVISYNIWNGFDWGKDLTRKGNLVAWVKAQNPDVVALQELCGYTHEQLLKDAKKWGHSYAEILKSSNYYIGITSKKPIKVKERIVENMHHGTLHCQTNDIDFFVLHFSPFSHKKRHQEAKAVLSRLSSLPKQQNKYIVLGDFNAVSPFDAHLYRDNKSLIEQMKANDKKHEHVKNLFYGNLEYGVMAKFLGFPLIDVTEKFVSSLDDKVSAPTQIFETKKGEGRPSKSIRIDYILTSPFLASKCISSSVENKADTYYLSDHYPVIAEFRLD